MNGPTFDLALTHRWFAASLNNQAWDLLESETRTVEQDELMRNTAHAACRHWWEVGEVINHQRAECLLAQVHAALGEPAAGVHHAVRALELMAEAGEAIEASDRVFTHDAAARAFRLIGRPQEESRHRAEVESARIAISDESDRRVIDEWLGRETPASP